MKKEYKILVVCSANKGRSASYHAHMKHFLKEKKIDHIKIDSAGINFPVIEELYKIKDLGADPIVKDIMNKQGIYEINEHKVKAINQKLMEEYDLILTYNTKIRDKINELYPQHKDKVQTVRGYVTGKEGDLPSEALNVDDAYRPDKKLYRGKMEPKTYKSFSRVVDESKRLAKKTLEKLLQVIGEK